MLTGYNDCGLRAAVHQWPDLFRSDGYQVAAETRGAAAAVGQSVHAGIAWSFVEKMRTDQLGDLDQAVDRAIADWDDQTGAGVQWDEITATRRDATGQIARMTRIFLAQKGMELRPMMVERRLTCRLPTGRTVGVYRLTGQPDLVAEGGRLPDLKTGKVNRGHYQQLGGYSLLARAHDYQVTQPSTIFVKRLPMIAAQELPVETRYDRDFAERSARAQVRRIVTDVENYLADGARSTLAFPANPMSNLCSARYCRAYGTDTCEFWKAKEIK